MEFIPQSQKGWTEYQRTSHGAHPPVTKGMDRISKEVTWSSSPSHKRDGQSIRGGHMEFIPQSATENTNTTLHPILLCIKCHGRSRVVLPYKLVMDKNNCLSMKTLCTILYFVSLTYPPVPNCYGQEQFHPRLHLGAGGKGGHLLPLTRISPLPWKL